MFSRQVLYSESFLFKHRDSLGEGYLHACGALAGFSLLVDNVRAVKKRKAAEHRSLYFIKTLSQG